MSEFVYITYIRTTPEQLWDALTRPDFTRQYWFGVSVESDYKAGSPWRMVYPDGRLTDSGEIIEAEKPRRIVIKWLHELRPELKGEGYSRCTIEIEPMGASVQLKIVHEIDCDRSKLIEAVSGGWPKIMASLKSLLETGQALTAEINPKAAA